MSDFYDRLAGLYHLVYASWDDSVARQGEQLARVIRNHWPQTESILDVSCGIGTQAIGLAERGFVVTGSDLSPPAIARARAEAERRSVAIEFSTCDMREAYAHHNRQFDVVISADNSITHLLCDDDLLAAFGQMYRCTRPGGGCLLTVRDYDREERGTGLIKPYGVRTEDGKRYVVFQVWDFAGELYDMAMYFVVDDGKGELVTHVMRTRYSAISTDRLLELLRRAGFVATERIDGCFYQPVLVGTREVVGSAAV